MGNDHRWYGRPIISQDHIEGLEHDAAIHEFQDGHPRERAEELAYAKYKSEHHKAAAAHHLVGIRAARAANDLEEAQKHGAAYSMHLQALGLEPTDPVHPDIEAMTKEMPKVYRFKSHKGDTFLVRK